MASTTTSLSYSLHYYTSARTPHAPSLPTRASIPKLLPHQITPLRVTFKRSSISVSASSRSSSSTGAMTSAAQNAKKVEVFDTEEKLAKYTAGLSEKFGKERGSFTVVLSGGSLIKALRKLTEGPYVDDVEWGKWHVFWVDERVVPKDHEDSNYKLAFDGFLSKAINIYPTTRKTTRKATISLTRPTPSERPWGVHPNVRITLQQEQISPTSRSTREHQTQPPIYVRYLLQVPIPAGNVYAINDALSPEGATDDYETGLKHLVTNGVLATSKTSGFPKFDLMLLGMGPDGHVASLFPGHPLVNEKEKWVTFIKDSPKPPPERITFTFPVINSSAYIAMVVNGAGKSSAVQAALGKSENSDTLPVQLVAPEGELTWFLDKEAASKL